MTGKIVWLEKCSGFSQNYGPLVPVSAFPLLTMKLKLRGTLKEPVLPRKRRGTCSSNLTPVGLDLVINVLFMIIVDRFSKRTETSFDDGAHSTSTQIWSKYNRIWTIPRVLPSSTDVPIVLLHQPTKLNSKSSTASIPQTTLKIPKRDKCWLKPCASNNFNLQRGAERTWIMYKWRKKSKRWFGKTLKFQSLDWKQTQTPELNFCDKSDKASVT